MSDGMTDAARMEDYWRGVEAEEEKNDAFNKLYATDVFGWIDRRLEEYRYKRHALLHFIHEKDTVSADEDRRALEEMRPRIVKMLRDLADKLEKKL